MTSVDSGSIEMMDCAKYHARISVSTCLARRRKALAAGTAPGWGGNSRAYADPGCFGCGQGEVMAALHMDAPAAPKPKSARRAPRAELTPGGKTCRRCGRQLEMKAFSFLACSKDSRDSTCRACRKEQQVAWRAARLRRERDRTAAPAAPPPIGENRGGGDPRGPAAAAADRIPLDQIWIERISAEEIVMRIGVGALEHLDIFVRPRRRTIKEEHA